MDNFESGNHIQKYRQPAFQETKLGWIVGGELHITCQPTSLNCLLLTEDLDEKLEQFWKIEEVHTQKKKQIQQDFCEIHFSKTHTRDREGRFIVELPKDDKVKLGDSFEQALRRFKSLERRLEKNAELKKEYTELLQDYENQGHMSQIQDEEDETTHQVYYIPHQPVIRESSVSTKLRVVFDVSAKTSLGTSLNDMLLPGPNLQNDLVQILFRFRTWRYIITGDVAQMFRQIYVSKLDRNLQRILWRKNPGDPIQIFILNTVTQGTANAPFLAMRCLRQISLEARAEFSRAAEAMEDDFYMDDFLSGANLLQEAIELQEQVSTLSESGKFCLRKWRANDKRILQHIKDSEKTDELLILD